MTQLSEHFSLHEFTRSQIASREGIDNTPFRDEIAAMRLLCEAVLEPVREHFGKAVYVSSGFRCPALNKAAKGSKTSDHRTGRAVDIEIFGVSNAELARWIRDNLLFDQLILEYHVPGDPQSGWVHVSFRDGGNRNEAKTKLKGGPYVEGISG